MYQLLLTEAERDHLLAALHIAGFREKSEFPKGLRKGRNVFMREMGIVMKKLRKAEKLEMPS